MGLISRFKRIVKAVRSENAAIRAEQKDGKPALENDLAEKQASTESAMGSPDDPELPKIEKVPVLEVKPEAYPMLYRHKNAMEEQKINLQDLGTDLCIRMEGSLEGLQAGLKRVMENYKAEISLEESDGVFQLDTRAMEIRKQVIKYNHEIKLLQDDLIPEKQKELHELQRQIENHSVVYAGTQMPEQMIYEDEVQTTLHLAIARGNELVRRFRARLKELAGAIEQEQLSLDSIEKRRTNLNFFNLDLLMHKLNIFFVGWLSGLNGLNAEENIIKGSHEAFKAFAEAIKADPLPIAND